MDPCNASRPQGVSTPAQALPILTQPQTASDWHLWQVSPELAAARPSPLRVLGATSALQITRLDDDTSRSSGLTAHMLMPLHSPPAGPLPQPPPV